MQFCGGLIDMMQIKTPERLERYLTRTLSGSVFTWREILNLIIPGVLDSLSIMFINMLIAALISKNGEESVAAISLAGPIGSLITCIFNGISAGGTVVVAQCCGKKDPILLQRAVGMTLWMTVLIGVTVCLPFLLFPRQILMALYPDAEATVMAKARTFMSGNVWTIVVFTLYTAIFAILRGLGESKKCMWLSIIINVAYLLFSLLFLNVLNLDIQGSVLALLLARIVGALSAVVALFFWKPSVRVDLRHLFAYEPVLLHSTLQVSLPFILEQLCYSAGSVVSQMYMLHLGTTAIYINSTANNLLGFLTSPAMSASSLSVTVVGRCVGAKEYDEAYRYGKRCNQIALLFLILASLIFYPLLPVLLRQYNPSAEAFVYARNLLLASIPFLLLFWGKSYTLPSTLRASSDTLFPTLVSLGVLWAVSIGLGYLLAVPCGLGLWGVWIATWSAWAIRSTAFDLRFRSRKWLHISHLGKSEG